VRNARGLRLGAHLLLSDELLAQGPQRGLRLGLRPVLRTGGLRLRPGAPLIQLDGARLGYVSALLGAVAACVSGDSSLVLGLCVRLRVAELLARGLGVSEETDYVGLPIGSRMPGGRCHGAGAPGRGGPRRAPDWSHCAAAVLSRVLSRVFNLLFLKPNTFGCFFSSQTHLAASFRAKYIWLLLLEPNTLLLLEPNTFGCFFLSQTDLAPASGASFLTCFGVTNCVGRFLSDLLWSNQLHSDSCHVVCSVVCGEGGSVCRGRLGSVCKIS